MFRREGNVKTATDRGAAKTRYAAEQQSHRSRGEAEHQKYQGNPTFRRSSDSQVDGIKDADADGQDKLQRKNSARQPDRSNYQANAQNTPHNRRSPNVGGDSQKKPSRLPDSPPPDPKFNFLADPSRTGPLNPKKTSRRPRGCNSSDERSSGKKQGYDADRRANLEKRHSLNKKDLELTMTGRERLNYLKWKEEREKIDADRLSRQHTADGQWQREWDACKVLLDGDSAEPSFAQYSGSTNRRSSRKDAPRFRPSANGNAAPGRRANHLRDSGGEIDNESPLGSVPSHKSDVDTVRFSFREIELDSKRQSVDRRQPSNVNASHPGRNARQPRGRQGRAGSGGPSERRSGAIPTADQGPPTVNNLNKQPLRICVSQKSGGSSRRVTICDTVTEIPLSSSNGESEEVQNNGNEWRGAEDYDDSSDAAGSDGHLGEDERTAGADACHPNLSGQGTVAGGAGDLQSVEEIERNMIRLMNKNIEEVEAVLDTNDVIDTIGCCNALLTTADATASTEQVAADCMNDLLSLLETALQF